MNFLKKLAIDDINPGAAMGDNWWSVHRGKLLKSYNPANGKVIAEVNTCTAMDYETLMSEASLAFLQWRQVPAPQRGNIIRQIAMALRDVKADLGALVSLETGKSQQEGAGEVQEMIDIADLAVGQSRMLYGKMMQSERPRHRMYEQWHPLGIVGVISAFNFPVAVWAWNAFIAAICGNITLWKPSAKAPLCAIALQKICNKVLRDNDCPAIFGFFVPEDHALAEQFVDDPRIPLISFTGSTTTGRQVANKVAKRLGKTILELGGNNAIIVDETADLALAIPAIVFGAVGTAGQRCTTTRRVIIQDSIYQEVLLRLKQAYQQVDHINVMGPLIDKEAVNHYQHALAQIKALGGTIEFGGNTLAGPGFYVEPTLVSQVNNDWPIVQQETFAPILYLLSYTTLEHALELHNGVKQGLSSAIFTTNLKHAEYYLSSLGSDCGIANVNIGTSGAEIGGAFGGEKDSGGGREAGSDCWKAYMRRQTNTINWSDSLPLAQGIEFEI